MNGILATGSSYLVVREETQPAETAENVLSLLRRAKLGLGINGSDEVFLIWRGSSDKLLQGILPGNSLLAEALVLVVEEANIDQDLDELGEASITKGTTARMLEACRVPE